MNDFIAISIISVCWKNNSLFNFSNVGYVEFERFVGYPDGDIQWAVRYNGLKLKREVWVEDKYWWSSSCIVANAIGMGELKKEFWRINKM